MTMTMTIIPLVIRLLQYFGWFDIQKNLCLNECWFDRKFELKSLASNRTLTCPNENGHNFAAVLCPNRCSHFFIVFIFDSLVKINIFPTMNDLCNYLEKCGSYCPESETIAFHVKISVPQLNLEIYVTNQNHILLLCWRGYIGVGVE